MAQYTYPGKRITIVEALDAAIQQALPHLGVAGLDTSGDALAVLTAAPLADADKAALDAFVAAYVEPPCYLSLQRSQMLTMQSGTINTADDFAYLQTLTVVPPDPSDVEAAGPGGLTESIKTVVRCTTGNLDYFRTWDSNADPITATVRVWDWATASVVASNTVDFSSNIAALWVPLARGEDLPAAHAAYSNMQLFGPCVCQSVQVYGATPTAAAIWQLHGRVSNSNVSISLNGLQQLQYAVLRPTPTPL